jgi:hypothetical protein
LLTVVKPLMKYLAGAASVAGTRVSVTAHKVVALPPTAAVSSLGFAEAFTSQSKEPWMMVSSTVTVTAGLPEENRLPEPPGWLPGDGLGEGEGEGGGKGQSTGVKVRELLAVAVCWF